MCITVVITAITHGTYNNKTSIFALQMIKIYFLSGEPGQKKSVCFKLCLHIYASLRLCI